MILSVLMLSPLESLPPSFSFTLGDVPSAQLLSEWNTTVESYPIRGKNQVNRTRTIYFQPTPTPVDTSTCTMHSTSTVCDSFGLQLIVEQTTYAGLRDGATAKEWTIEFRNTGPNTTRPLCNVQTMNSTLAMPASANLTVSAYSGQGRFGEAPPNPFVAPAVPLGVVPPLNNHFHPRLATFPVGSTHHLGSGTEGRSSEGGLPFWSAYTTTTTTTADATSTTTTTTTTSTTAEGPLPIRGRAPSYPGGRGAPRFSCVTVSVGWSGYWAATLSRHNAGLRMAVGQGE